MPAGELDYSFIVLGLLWLGGGNLIIALSLKRQNIPLAHMLTPTVFTKLKSKDWWQLLALAVITLFIAPYL